MPYRAAAQLWQYISGLSEEDQPAEALSGLIAPNGHPHRDGVVDVPQTGELAGLYRRGTTEPAGTYDMVFSGRLDFVFNAVDERPIWMSAEPETGFNFTCALIAKTLAESRFRIEAGALRWETYLSLAWTEWPVLQASFSWTRHEHPTPLQLMKQTSEWATFLGKLLESEGKLETYAYAWIYYQRQWNGCGFSQSQDSSVAFPKLTPTHPKDLIAKPTSDDWDALLNFNAVEEIQKHKWLRETLPLLARPELGFPPEVQDRLLAGILQKDGRLDEKMGEELRQNRRRGATDAKVAAAMQRNKVMLETPKEEEIKNMIETIDKVYSEGHDRNPWLNLVEKSSRKTTSTNAPDQP
jgi:hypothetical protein